MTKKNLSSAPYNYQLCDWPALDIMLTYHGDQLLEHHLAILANFPETFPPREYGSLLPEAK